MALYERPILLKATAPIEGSPATAGDAVHVWPGDPGFVYIVRVEAMSVARVVSLIRSGVLVAEQDHARTLAALQSLARLIPPPELSDPDRRQSTR